MVSEVSDLCQILTLYRRAESERVLSALIIQYYLELSPFHYKNLVPTAR